MTNAEIEAIPNAFPTTLARPRARLGERAARCEVLTLDAVQAWNGWLAPYTRLDTGRTF